MQIIYCVQVNVSNGKNSRIDIKIILNHYAISKSQHQGLHFTNSVKLSLNICATLSAPNNLVITRILLKY